MKFRETKSVKSQKKKFQKKMKMFYEFRKKKSPPPGF